MSLLLDALRKAEQERRLGQPPSALDDPPTSTEPEAGRASSPRYRKSLFLLALVVLCTLALLLPSLGLRRAEAPIVPAVPVLAASPAPSPTPTVAAARARPIETERLDSLNSLVLPPPPPRPRAVATASGEVPAGAPSPEELATVEEGEDLGQAATEIAAAPAPTAAPTLGPPRLSDLPPDQRERLPSYRFDVHVWNADPARRFVLLNGKRYREGDRTDEGPALVEILNDGIVIDADGLRVRIPRPG
jgi:general secretion pathway protein B